MLIAVPKSINLAVEALSERARDLLANLARKSNRSVDDVMQNVTERALARTVAANVESLLEEDLERGRAAAYTDALRAQVEAAVAPVVAARGNGTGRPGERSVAELKATAIAHARLTEIGARHAGQPFPADIELPRALTAREVTLLHLADEARILGKSLTDLVKEYRARDRFNVFEDVKRDALGALVGVAKGPEVLL